MESQQNMFIEDPRKEGDDHPQAQLAPLPWGHHAFRPQPMVHQTKLLAGQHVKGETVEIIIVKK